MAILASRRPSEISPSRGSGLGFALKLSPWPFSRGLPGSMKAVLARDGDPGETIRAPERGTDLLDAPTAAGGGWEAFRGSLS